MSVLRYPALILRIFTSSKDQVAYIKQAKVVRVRDINRYRRYNRSILSYFL
jgi:hypothetical protein